MEVSVRSEQTPAHQIESVINLSSINPAEKEKLAKEIQQKHGNLRVFVHPFFDEYGSREFENRKPDLDATTTNQRILSLISNDSKDKPPILIMEELDHLPETTARIKEILKGSTQRVYIIETYNDCGVPRFNGQWLDDKTEIEEWKSFRSLLKDINVDKILLGGMLFDIRDYFPDKDNLHYGKQMAKKGATDREWYAAQCVGRVANNLAANFDIEISNFTWPTNRRKFHERIGRTKLI